MFILHSSNKTENLVAHLTAVMQHQPLASPFSKELFLIQSQGMERWLSQQLANELGVWANYEFLFPNKFFNFVAKRIDSRLNDEAFDRHKMLWRIEALLRCLHGEEFASLQQYLNDEQSNNALKRYQLAQQLSQLFDQYQMMRPDMLTAWQNNQLLYKDTASESSERWQRALWQQLIAQTGNKHRGFLWQAATAKLNQAGQGAFSDRLPERVFIFGLTTLPPLFLNYLIGLSQHCDVHFFLLNPCQEYWLDLPTKRQQIKQAVFEGFEEFVGHSLLVSLGQQGREFLQVLLEEEGSAFAPFEFNSFEDVAHATPNSLQCLQNDILFNQQRQTQQADNSISIHACHSRMREVEVLKNQLLQTLEADKTLELRDVVVMSPDIQVYEPFISAVFHDIQHAIADRSLRLSNHALDAFIDFLDISQSRFGWQTVLDLLARPLVYENFALTSSDLELIEHWLSDTHVRWGKSAAHKAELGLPEFSENTWQATLDRLLMGYAIGDDSDFVVDILPYREIEGSAAQALGGLAAFMALLFDASKEFKQPKILNDWREKLQIYAKNLLGDADTFELQELNNLLLKLPERQWGILEGWHKKLKDYAIKYFGEDSAEYEKLKEDLSDELSFIKHSKTLQIWNQQLQNYATQLFGKNNTLQRQLNVLLDELSSDLAFAYDDEVELMVIISWLNGEVSERKSSQGFLRGQLTFCSMLPMRSIPFKVIALLGMNEGEFPKLDNSPTFDLLAQNFRKGDRSRRADDRYQFLEILLSTRQQLIITYIGQSISHNESIAPSVIISELLEALQCYGLNDVVTRQPLQAFSARYFENGNSALFSFSSADCETAKALSAPKSENPLWWQGVSSAPTERVIELADMFRFFRHPQRYFLQRQLDTRFVGLSDIIEEREPFSIDKLSAYSLYQSWLEKLLHGKRVSVHELQARGLWLHGSVGFVAFIRQEQQLQEFVARIQRKQLGERVLDMPIDLSIDGYRLIGKLSNCCENGSLLYRYASLKGKDFLAALLHHLLMNSIQPQTTFLLSHNADKEQQYDELRFLPKHYDATTLSALIALYQQGQQQPDAFFVEAALVYLKQAYDLASGSASAKSPLEMAQERLAWAIAQDYEPELRRLYAGVNVETLLGDVFEQQCQGILQKFWWASQTANVDR